ncbi:hypothetical protein BN946_scf184701.g7 [Trametes cinnabarina]|uniref:Uncharacterized protein n=1 Tax=Pycnoporus cinnabarinus TaxID=5643 RepID=A0A060T109_PYCCI|nr:hypothetical protein BN946_scf184701.g7 [Trametes cinnabarina]
MFEYKRISVAGNLNGSIDLTLAFISPDADFSKIVPLAWKVFTLTDGGTSVLKSPIGSTLNRSAPHADTCTEVYNFPWSNIIGGCYAKMDSGTQVVSGHGYTQIPNGHSCSLLKDHSPPTELRQRKIQLVNRSRESADICGGFITDCNEPNEAFHPVVVFSEVLDQNPICLDYAPILHIWATLDFAQSQKLDESVTWIPPLWKGDLSKIGPADSEVSFTVKRVNGALVVEGPKVFVAKA